MNEYFGLTFNDHVILYAINITDWSGVDEEILSFFRARKTPVIHTNLLLNDILSNSYGLLIFQEQLMEIAQRIGGLSLEDSDDLRRYMAKKTFERHDKIQTDVCSECNKQWIYRAASK